MQTEKITVLPHPKPFMESSHTSSSLIAYQDFITEMMSDSPETLLVIQSHGGIHPEGLTFTVPQENVFEVPTQAGIETMKFDAPLAAQVQTSLHDYQKKTFVLDEQALPLPALIIAQQLRMLKMTVPQIVVIGVSLEGGRAHYDYGRLIERALQSDSKRTAVLVSGQLSHCHDERSEAGIVPAAAEYDELFQNIVQDSTWDGYLHVDPFLIQEVGEDLYRPFAVGLGIMDALKNPLSWKPKGYEILNGVGCLLGQLTRP